MQMLLALTMTTAALVDHPRTYVASIVRLNLGPREYVDSFAIKTWGVTFNAVCRIPPGWRIKAGRSAAPDGELTGEGTQGATFLGHHDVSKLHALVLLTLSGSVQQTDLGNPDHGSGEPATFKGPASVGTYGGDGPGRTIPITFANVRLEPATRCPDIQR